VRAALVLLAALCALAAPARAEDPPSLAVIVSSRWDGLDAVTLALLRELWMGRRSELDGERIECFDFPAGHELRRVFGSAVLGRSERALEEYWIRQALTGGRVPPRELDGTAEIVRAVAARPGAIGYVDADALRALPDPGVRVVPVSVDGRPLLPGSPGYPIRGRAPRTPAVNPRGPRSASAALRGLRGRSRSPSRYGSAWWRSRGRPSGAAG
jgi:hypothetical protein